MTDWGEHYKGLFERASREADWNKARLFEAWRTMAGQTRGLQRQARLIKRLHAEIAALRVHSADGSQNAG